MPVHVVGKQFEKSVRFPVDRGNQAIVDALSDHGPLLARNGQHVGLNLRKYLLAECDVEILCRPIRMPGVDIAKLEMINIQLACQRLCFLLECCSGLRGRSGSPAIDGKGQGDQRIAKESALDVG